VKQHWVITGLMGAGKTTIGRRLAAASGRPFVDNDEQLFTRTGRTAHDIRELDGFDVLHRFEREAFAAALEVTTPSVIAAAASTVDDDATRALMQRAADVVWLRVPVDVLANRVHNQAHRPLAADAAPQLAEQMKQRAAKFQEVADVVVDADRPPDEIVAEILGRLDQ
jgi:shikimate kinase